MGQPLVLLPNVNLSAAASFFSTTSISPALSASWCPATLTSALLTTYTAKGTLSRHLEALLCCSTRLVRLSLAPASSRLELLLISLLDYSYTCLIWASFSSTELIVSQAYRAPSIRSSWGPVSMGTEAVAALRSRVNGGMEDLNTSLDHLICNTDALVYPTLTVQSTAASLAQLPSCFTLHLAGSSHTRLASALRIWHPR